MINGSVCAVYRAIDARYRLAYKNKRNVVASCLR